MQNKKNYMGFDHVWWQGVVEDRMDPLKIGRCRVRILGFHTEDKNLIPTEDLPWAYPAMPVNSDPESTPTGPREGTWVMGFFRDGQNAQEPIMTHQIDYGYVNENSPDVGFNDPELNTNKPKKPSGVIGPEEGEINTNTLALGDNSDTLSGNRTQYTDIATATGGSWSEPDNPYAATYPYNRVTESESGHVVEIDDTPGAERLSETHRSGSFREIHPTGDRVVQIIGNDYDIVIKNKYVYINGNLNINIAGNSTEQITGNKVIKNAITDIESDSQIKLKSGTLTVDASTINLKGSVKVQGSLTVGTGTVITSGTVQTGGSLLTAAGLVVPTISAGGGFGADGGEEGLGEVDVTAVDLNKFSWQVQVDPNTGIGSVIAISGDTITKRVTETGTQKTKMQAEQTPVRAAGNLAAKGLSAAQEVYTAALDTLSELENTLTDAEESVTKYSALESTLTSQLNSTKAIYGIS